MKPELDEKQLEVLGQWREDRAANIKYQRRTDKGFSILMVLGLVGLTLGAFGLPLPATVLLSALFGAHLSIALRRLLKNDYDYR